MEWSLKSLRWLIVTPEGPGERPPCLLCSAEKNSSKVMGAESAVSNSFMACSEALHLKVSNRCMASGRRLVGICSKRVSEYCRHVPRRRASWSSVV